MAAGELHASGLLKLAGFPQSALRDGVGVMGAESGFDASIVNSAPCSPDGKEHAVGLMQICTVHRGKMSIPAEYGAAVKYLQNPVHNVTVAYKIWKANGRSFKGPWEAYNNGNYRNFRGQDPIIKNIPTSGGIPIVGDVVEGVKDTASATADLASALLNPNTWVRLGKGALGGALLILGAGAIVFVIANKASSSLPTKQIIKAVSK